MGYYSDAALVLSKSGVATLKRLMAGIPKDSEAYKDSCCLILHPDKQRTDPKTRARLFFWKDVKWYDDFPEIRFIEDLLDALDECEFVFCRIGEDFDDSEMRGFFRDDPFGVGIERSLRIGAA